MNIEVEIVGLRELVRKADPTTVLSSPVERMMHRIVLFGQGEARKGAKPHTGDTGELARSIDYEVSSNPIPLSGKVFTNLHYAPFAEQGRGPGRQPPVDEIRLWALRHGITAPPFVIARAIGRRGTKGLHFMRKAATAIERKLPQFVRQAERDIEREFLK